MELSDKIFFSELVTALKSFQVNDNIFSEAELESEIKQFLIEKNYKIEQQQRLKGIGRNDLVITTENGKKICIELKINANAGVVEQIDNYLQYYDNGLILLCWHSSKTLKTIFSNVKKQIKIPLEIIEIKKNQMIV